MGRLWGRLRRLEDEAEAEMLVIPQRDGTVARFPQSEGMEAYMNFMDRLGAADDAPPEHPLLKAVRNSSDPEWQNSFYFVNAPDAHTQPVEDLSE